MFFCKYYDPLYIKMEKLDIIVPLTTDDTLEQVCRSASTLYGRSLRFANTCSLRHLLQPQKPPFPNPHFLPRLAGSLDRRGRAVFAPWTRGRTPWQVLSEFKDYCQEVDVEFVRRAVRCLGRLATPSPATTPFRHY